MAPSVNIQSKGKAIRAFDIDKKTYNSKEAFGNKLSLKTNQTIT
jgi:hypothetical protein